MAEGNDVQIALKAWRDGLVGLTRASRLIKFNAPRTSSLRFEHPDGDAILDLIETGRPVRVIGHPEIAGDGEAEISSQYSDEIPAHTIVAAREEKHVGPVLRNLMRRANTEYLDKGLSVLYVAFGLLLWHDADGTQMKSPLLLVPVSLVPEGPKGTPRVTSGEDEAVVNPALALRLRDFNIELPTIEDGIEIRVSEVLAQIEAALAFAPSFAGWELSSEVHISTFSFAKEAMFRDLLDNEEAIIEHPLFRAVATSDPLKQSDEFQFEATGVGDIDDIAPAETNPLVLDADSSQRVAVHAAVSGKSFVMDGPPGTGKSQTIANMIGALLHDGKTVLFVSEKMAALDVVRNRLTDAGLGSYLLELHSHKASRREVATQLLQALDTVIQPGGGADELAGVSALERRKQLDDYARAMNEPREPWRRSLHDMIGEFSRLDGVPQAPPPEIAPSSLSYHDVTTLPAKLSQLARSWRPVQEGASFLWRDVTDRTSLELRVTRAASALDHLLTAMQFSQGLVNAIGVTELEDVATVVEVLDHQHRDAPVDAIERFLTISDIAIASDAVESLAAARDEALRCGDEVVRLAGVTADAVPDGPVKRELWRVSPSIAHGISVEALTAHDLTSLANESRRHLESLEPALELADKLAVAFELGKIEAFHDIDRLVRTNELRRSSERFPSAWLTADGLEQAQAYLQRAQRKARKLDEVEAAARQVFVASALQAPLAELENRFANLHTGLKKLSGAYRTDKRVLAGLLVEATNVKEGIAHLSQAVEWSKADQAFGSIGHDAPALLGVLWRGRETDFAAIAREMSLARQLHDLFPRGLPEGVKAGFRDRDPEPAVNGMCDQIRDAVVEWQTSLVDSTSISPPSALSIEPPAVSVNWLKGHLAYTDDVIQRVIDVDRAVGRACTVAEAHEVTRVAAQAREAATRFADERAKFAEAFPAEGASAGADVARLAELLEHTQRLREIFGGPLQVSQVEAIGKSFPNPELHGRLEAWRGCRKAISAAFAADRAREIEHEMATARDAAALLEAFRDDTVGQDEWFAYLDAIAALEPYGLRSSVDYCIGERLPSDSVVGALMRALVRTWIDAEYLADERLRPALGIERDALADAYRTLDRDLISRATSAIVRAANTRRPANTAIGEPAVIRREGAKQKRHIPVRDLIDRARTAVQAVKPVFMMSPLAVSQYLPSDLRFDVVIFDEASQVTPGDAVNCIYRGRSLILAGDDKQLPPTSFFDRVVDDDELEDDSDAKDFQSVLELAKASGAFNNLGLRWHYRSRHEDLIAFSNYKFYDGKLVTYPSAASEGENVGVNFYHASGTYRRGGGADNPTEARKVAERVIEHYRNRPDLTLGVVTFSVAQADAVMAAVDEARESHRDLDAYFDTSDRLNGFFVRSLESVQGDERDVIIFSIGYGPDEAGKITTNFGVLNKDKGWRRLNVGITRARQRVEVVASLRGGDIPPSANESVNYLRDYLEYAEKGQSTLAIQYGATNLGPESPFEESVIKAITSWGYKVEAQVGTAGYRIDIGVRDPARPGRYVLAVECDGFQYHSAPAARDRDRLRDEVLTGLGWRMHRIWGTAWYRNRVDEEARLRSAIEHAVEVSDDPIDIEHLRVSRPELVEEVATVDEAPTWIADYIQAPRTTLPGWVDPAEPANFQHLVAGVTTLAEVEGPVHIEVALERLRAWWNVGRVSARLRANVESAINRGGLAYDSEFLDIPGRGVRAVRREAVGPVRKAEHVHSGEIALAVEQLVTDAGGAQRSEIVTTVARLFGWARTSSAIERRINVAIDGCIGQGYLVDQEGSLRPSR
ncbi:DUF4011 domain-containing protein [Demequina sp. NBRC 110055]|uniref:DUF4011 domain-containing protein n=1 Tax=Demequina sp. NBRC 110055 TaxID=1570344 RepID=UPI0013566A9B|nr:DUF4011 domain-containing protein [Demequina sp. NBRC 110055]